MDYRKKLKITIALMWILLFVMAGYAQADSEHKIEQVYINMPDVTTYYRSNSEESNLIAYLDGEKLSLVSNQIFSETGEGIEYYVLLDISASIRSARFADIKTSLIHFTNALREQDRLVLLTFGDQTQVRLTGDENRDEAVNIIGQLENHDQNTVFFNAIDQVTDMISTASAQSQMRRVTLIISDGKDCSDNTRNMDSVEKNLTANGIPVYTIAVENNQGDTETEISDYQGKFSALARNTGGVPWTTGNEEESIYGALDTDRNTILGSFRAVFHASTNRVSNKTEEFVLQFPDAGNVTDSYSVMVARNQADTTSPTVSVTVGEQNNELKISYSEAVENADNISNYVLKKDETVVPAKQIVKASEENTYKIIFDQQLYNGKYSMKITNITDTSNEKNKLQNEEIEIDITENEDEPEPEEDSLLDKVLKWWPIVLTVVVIVLMILIISVVRYLRKKKGLTVINGEVIDEAKMENRLHIVSQQSDRPQKTLILWMSNGASEEKRSEFTVDGSAIVGRSKQCDICCDDPMMSRQHFVLEVDEENVYVSDLETKNGTMVNGVAIKEKYRLQKYDEIIAGNIKFRIEW